METCPAEGVAASKGIYKGERSPALAEPCDSTLSCRHNSDVTHDNTLLKNVIFSAPSQPTEGMLIQVGQAQLEGSTEPETGLWTGES